MIHEINISFLFSLELHGVMSCLYIDILLLLTYSGTNCCEVFLCKSLMYVFSLLKDKIQSISKSSGRQAIFFVFISEMIQLTSESVDNSQYSSNQIIL